MRILVVEDEARIRAFLGRAFEAEGFVVDVVSDGEQGLERALSGAYDGVVLDLLLPGQGGLEVLRQLHLRHHDLPVLILSARSDIATKLRGFELGAVDYIVKPFSLEELLARLRLHLRRAAGGGHARATVRCCASASWPSTWRGVRRAWATRSPTWPTASSACCTS